MADLEKNRQDIDETIGECAAALRKQRLYYDSIRYLDIMSIDPDIYYDGLKDWSQFREPKDTSRRDAEKDSGVSLFLKVKAFFSDEAKKELFDKKVKADVLEKEYAKYY